MKASTKFKFEDWKKNMEMKNVFEKKKKKRQARQNIFIHQSI